VPQISGSQEEPGGFRFVPGDAVAPEVTGAEVNQRFCGAVLCGFLQPAYGLLGVGFQLPEAVLAFGMALYGGFAKPLKRSGAVAGDAFTGEEPGGKFVLRLGIAVGCGFVIVVRGTARGGKAVLLAKGFHFPL